MTTSVILIIVVLKSIVLCWPSVMMRSASGRFCVGMTRVLIRSEISFGDPKVYIRNTDAQDQGSMVCAPFTLGWRKGDI
jgi:hypothetical protein